MPFSIGENVGPYRITEQLGQGGMATVYKAYHAALDRYVALKALHPAFNEDKSFAARFQREARVVAKLEHPNIVPIYDYAEHESRPYLVMKYIEGDTLKARLLQGPLSSEEINQVVDSVGSALAYAHQQGILHRDIKPSNVLIGTDGIMYLADFGLARIAQAGESTLSSDSIMGTPQYISPEQAMGKKELDEGTDIYSFGVMLYEMVVGQVPFTADTPFSIIHDHIYSPLPMPRAINPQVPESVERVLLKALAKERADRYDTVPSLVKAFKDAWREAGVPMQGTSITMKPRTVKTAPKAAQVAGPGGATVAAQKVPQKKRSPWMFIAGGVVILLCGALGAFVLLRRGVLPPTASIPQTVVASPTVFSPPSQQAEPATPEPGLPVSPAVAEAQKKVQQNPSDPHAHLELSLALLDAGQARPAYEELAQAAILAGVNNKDFFLKAAHEYYAREAWIGAGAMYLRVIRIEQNAGVRSSQEIFDHFHESVYKASEQPDMPKYLFIERIKEVDEPMALVAQARQALYNGSPQEAKIYLDQANKLKPDFIEALLFTAELDFKTGKEEEAKQILTVLRSDLGAPNWIRLQADAYYKAIP